MTFPLRWCLCMAALLIFRLASAQQSLNRGLRVHIDCPRCDMNYLRQELPFIDYVRDQGLADVQVFIREISNASGGSSFEFTFTGRESFRGNKSSFIYATPPTMTADEVREGLARRIAGGLMPFIMDTPLADAVSIQVAAVEAQGEALPLEDPWKNWIFEVWAEVDLEQETSRGELDMEVGVSSDRVTENWRIRNRLEFNYSKDRFTQQEKDIVIFQRRHYFDGSAVRSLGAHWSAGVFGGISHDTYANLDLAAQLAPALEYSIYPYREVIRREITLAYRIGYNFYNYLNTTIYDRQDEGRFQQALDARIQFRQPWGNIFGRMEASTFLHDLNKNRVEFNGSVGIRLFRGLNLNAYTNMELIRDQINLPKGDASLEDVLLRQREIATNFQIQFGLGLSYIFGSAYNNIVNTRL